MDKAKAWDQLKQDLERWLEGGAAWQTPGELEIEGIGFVLEIMKRREEQA